MGKETLEEGNYNEDSTKFNGNPKAMNILVPL